MSVGEPIPMRGVLSAEWVLNYRQTTPFSLSGNAVTVDLGEPYWTADIRVEVVPESPLAREWSGFLMRRKGAQVSFTMPRFFRPRPLFTPETSASSAFISGFDRAASALSISNLPIRYVFGQGDMISYFTANGGYYIGEVQNEVIAENGSGIIEVSPPPFVPHSSTPDLRLSHAVGEFIMVDGPSGTESYSAKTYRFSAQQVLR